MSLGTEELAKRFGVADYVVFILILITSAAIGIYFGCTGGHQRTNREFLLADSFMSAITILGTPAEIYTYGTMYLWIILSFGSSMYIAGYIYIPLFYQLQVTSAYEYLELRFSKVVRVVAAACYILQMVMYMAIVLYAPSLALSAVTGIRTWVSVLAIGGVCAFYTAVGGMKAVIWTDTLQTLIMFSGMLAVIIQGSMDLGWKQIWKDASDTGRLDMFDWDKVFNPNPMERHTFWALTIGGTVYWTSTYGTNQAQVQRALSLPSLRKAQLSFWVNLPGLILIVAFGGWAGLIIYSQYKDCDPIQYGTITAKDQLYPLFVMETLGHIHGLPGLIVAAVASGALSTVSSGLNSLAAVTQADIINQMLSRPLPEEKATLVSKIIAASYGALCIGLTFVVGSMGGVLQAAMAFFGIFGGPIAGVFSLGMFFPHANSKGALAGLLSSLVMTMWIGIGSQFHKGYVYKYPTSVSLCPTLDNSTESIFVTSTVIEPSFSQGLVNATTPSVEQLIEQSREGLGGLYSVSYLWMTPIACLICAVVGMIISLATGGPDEEVDAELICPVADRFCCCLPLSIRKKMHCGIDHSTKLKEVKAEAETDVENTEL